MRSWKVLLFRMAMGVSATIAFQWFQERDWKIVLDRALWVSLGLVLMILYERMKIGIWTEEH